MPVIHPSDCTLRSIYLTKMAHFIKKPARAILVCLSLLMIVVIYLSCASDQHDNVIKKRSNIISTHQHQTANNRMLFESNPEYEPPDVQTSDKQAENLQQRIDDLKKTKASITDELMSMSSERAKLLREKSTLIKRNEKLLTQLSKSRSQLMQLELDISSNRKRKFEKNCDNYRLAPIVFTPLESRPIEEDVIQDMERKLYSIQGDSAKIYQFDMASCPLTERFKFRLKNINFTEDQGTQLEDYKIARRILESHDSYVRDEEKACLTIFIVSSQAIMDKIEREVDHRNSLIIDLSGVDHTALSSRAAIASSTYSAGMFRESLDIILPAVWNSPSEYNSLVGSIPLYSPIDRKYLASYFGRGSDLPALSVSSELDHPQSSLSSDEKILQMIHRNSIDDLFLFIYNCSILSEDQCFGKKDKIIEESIFLLILADKFHSGDTYTSQLLYSALYKGTIPVIVGSYHTRLPFDEVIDWRKAAIIIPIGRLPEIHLILSSFGPNDLYQLKYYGRKVFENYLATSKEVLSTIIGIISLKRFHHPPLPVNNIETINYYPSDQLIINDNCTEDACNSGVKMENPDGSVSGQEILGPREVPLASPSYTRNFSLVFNSLYDLWNNPMLSPFQLYPSSPLDPVAPSEFKFMSSYSYYRPIADGQGGSGSEFSRSLGGDYPNEQFTIVILTYERVELLMKTLNRLRGIPYLNKVIIVWNSVKQPPSANMVWPNIGAPIELVKVAKNSLNNRFTPYDKIETDAILTLDDDSPLRPDEIVFAFRVWRQSRDRIVGFPGRYHAWDPTQNSWTYNSNHSCELSMVLTGGAFFHRYYTYMYTFQMPKPIRDVVDKFMNCEDIAMNFLVAHLTRKPPIKVTSRWTFHCTGCTNSLSDDDSHFRERHECLNIFASIYGYMPLLSTQHRSDSILFKTRLPHDKQKCFKFV